MKLNSLGYKVYFEKKSFSHLLGFLSAANYSSIFIFCDSNTKKKCLPLLLKKVSNLQHAAVFAMPAGEKNKNLSTLAKCWNFLLEKKADRRSLVICLGGGVVCDLAGFAANTFKRGVDFIHVPTTLLAMADASVGGKTGIDHKGYKNIIGSFAQPKGVFINETFLKTLSARHVKNGFAEIIKAALIGNSVLWKKIIALSKLPPAESGEFIRSSVEIKNRIVLKDPNEKSIRQVLNFGHTAGHAIESYFLGKKNELLHGEAIVMGMCVELCLGKMINLTNATCASDVILFLKKQYSLRKFSSVEIKAFLKLVQHDKKNTNGEVHFALIANVARPLINVQASGTDIQKAFMLYNNLVA